MTRRSVCDRAKSRISMCAARFGRVLFPIGGLSLRGQRAVGRWDWKRPIRLSYQSNQTRRNYFLKTRSLPNNIALQNSTDCWEEGRSVLREFCIHNKLFVFSNWVALSKYLDVDWLHLHHRVVHNRTWQSLILQHFCRKTIMTNHEVDKLVAFILNLLLEIINTLLFF